MKKTLIASAVALATFATAGASAQEVNLPKVYGNIQLAVYQQDTELSDDGASIKDSDYGHVDNGSTIGFSHDHEIMPGMTGFLKAEFEFNGDRQKSGGNGLNRGDQAFIGVKGDFGTVQIGSYDTIYDDAINDTVSDVFEFYGGGTSSNTTDEGDTVTYYTPNFSGFAAAVSLQINGESDQSKLNRDADPNNDAARNAALAVLSYQMDDTKVALGWDSGDNTFDRSAYGLAVTQGMGNILLGFSFETQDKGIESIEVNGNPVDFDNFNSRDLGDVEFLGAGKDIFALRGAVTMGANQFQAVYKYVNFDSDLLDTAHELYLQALHNLSDNMYVYVESQWKQTDAKDDGGEIEATGIALGATYVF